MNDDLRDYLLSFDPMNDPPLYQYKQARGVLTDVTWIGPFPMSLDTTTRRLGTVLIDADTGRILSFKRDDQGEEA